MDLQPSPQRILIVDDQEEIARMLEDVLREEGFETNVAFSADEALRILSSKPFDLLITDIIMPGTDGLELARMTLKHHDTDVIVMTGYAENHSYEEVIGEGASDFLVKPLRPRETLLRIKRVLRERTLKKERDRVIRHLEELAITDSLTGLYNSRHFYERLSSEVSSSNRYGTPLSLLMLDLDDFKKFNDTFGHLEGDLVLVRVAEVLQSCLRKGDSAYRYGGEEFAVILTRIPLADAYLVAERIRETIEQSSLEPVPGTRIRVTSSIGVSEYRPTESMEDFIRRTDRALYRSKDSGKNTITQATD